MAVSAHEAHRLALGDFERNVPKGPEGLDGLAMPRMQQAQEPDLELDRGVVAQKKLFRQRLRGDDRHYTCSVKRSSNARISMVPMMNAPAA